MCNGSPPLGNTYLKGGKEEDVLCIDRHIYIYIYMYMCCAVYVVHAKKHQMLNMEQPPSVLWWLHSRLDECIERWVVFGKTHLRLICGLAGCRCVFQLSR